MNVFNIIDEVEKVDPEVYQRLDDRRAALKQFSGFAGKVAALSLPFMIGSMFKKAYGQTTSSVGDVLNYALTLEYLEAEFYTKGVAASGLIPSTEIAGFTTIRDHENQHVAFLKTALSGLGVTPVSKPTFDFTGGKGQPGGPYADVFTNFTTFLALSQAFEDTGVRAYKGQAANLMSNKAVLTAALQIHSVEARHASHVRRIRQNRGVANNKPWITGNNSGGLPAAIYAGEDNTTQAGVQITGINSMAVSSSAASESFDEPLTKDAVLSIASAFIV